MNPRHLGTIDPTNLNTQGHHLQVMKCIKGHGIDELILDESKLKNLSLKSRLQITIRLLRSRYVLQQTQASDVFSIGGELARLWGLYSSATDSDYDDETFGQFSKLLSEGKASLIQTVIKQMTLVTAAERPSLIAVLECFESCLLEVMLAEEKLSDINEAAVKDANKRAQMVFQNLQEIAASPEHSAEKRIALYKKQIRNELPNVMANFHAYNEFFRVLDIKYLQHKEPLAVINLLNRTENFVKNAYLQNEYQPILERLARLQAGLRDPGEHKYYANRIVNLTEKATAAQKRQHAPLTLHEFLKTEKKTKQTLFALSKQSFQLEAQLYAVDPTAIESILPKLGNLAALIEGNIKVLKWLFKTDPSFQQKFEKITQLYHEIQEDMQACQNAASIEELGKSAAAIKRRLIQYQYRYDAITFDTKKHLFKKANQLGSALKFFAVNSVHNRSMAGKHLLFQVEDYVTHLDYRQKHGADVISELDSLYNRSRKVCQQNLIAADRRFKPLFVLLNQNICTPNVHLRSVCQKMKAVIANYILSTTTTFNLFFNRRAASNDRIGTMLNILRNVNDPHEEKGFLLKMQGYLQAFRGNSELITGLRAIIDRELERARNPANNLRP